MDPNCAIGPPQYGEKPRKDGFGPRGAGECYYTSRVLNSTYRYVKFVKKLREEEEAQRVANIVKQEAIREAGVNEFFAHCARKSLMNKVKRRVDLCLRSYEDDIAEKRKKLSELLSLEEEDDIRLMVIQGQAGMEAQFQSKKDRLAYLLDKREKEHLDRYKDPPLSKCVHVMPCVYKMRCKEAQEYQLYQMQEKKSRKMQEKEMDKMWHEVLLKESEALSARMEYEVIEQMRRDKANLKQCEDQMRMRELQHAKDQEDLKQEVLRFKAKLAEDDRKEEEAERKRQENRRQVIEDSKMAMQERNEAVAKRLAEQKVISETWDSLVGEGQAAEQAAERRRRQQVRETNECNRKMIELRNEMAQMKVDNEPMILEEGRRRVDAVELKRCQYVKQTRQIKKDTQAAVQQQILDKEEALRNRYDATDDLNQQISNQLDQLIKHKELTDAQARKLHQKDLIEQIKYTDILKERARHDAMIERKKCQLVAEEYQKEVINMLNRPFYSDHVHPFLKQMSFGLKMRPKCPCSKGVNYCANPIENKH